MPYQPNTLALFGAADLADLAPPDMSPAALANELQSQLSSAMDWIDPIKGPIKAVCLAGDLFTSRGGIYSSPRNSHKPSKTESEAPTSKGLLPHDLHMMLEAQFDPIFVPFYLRISGSLNISFSFLCLSSAWLTAKIIIKILLEMMKRPIAHFDPALQV